MSTDPSKPHVPDNVRKDALHIPDPERIEQSETVDLVEDAVIVITQAFCQHSHPLIEAGNETFSGFPGVHLHIGHDGETIELTVSPIHGHHERKGGQDIEDGARVEIRCPQCEKELLAYAPCPCGKGTLHSIFLTPDAESSHVAAVCDVWGCQRSRIVDEWELISEFVED